MLRSGDCDLNPTIVKLGEADDYQHGFTANLGVVLKEAMPKARATIIFSFQVPLGSLATMDLHSHRPTRSFLSLSWALRSSLQYQQSGSEQWGDPCSSGSSFAAFARNGLSGHAAMLPPVTRISVTSVPEMREHEPRLPSANMRQAGGRVPGN
jgi:hypothetical protein